jgi:hypothetical protein
MSRGGKREGAGRKKGSLDTRPRSSPVLIASAQEKRELRHVAREFTDDAVNRLAEICKNGQSESARVAADLRGKGHQRTEGSEPYVSSALQDEAIKRRYDDLPLSRIVVSRVLRRIRRAGRHRKAVATDETRARPGTGLLPRSATARNVR